MIGVTNSAHCQRILR